MKWNPLANRRRRRLKDRLEDEQKPEPTRKARDKFTEKARRQP